MGAKQKESSGAKNESTATTKKSSGAKNESTATPKKSKQILYFTRDYTTSQLIRTNKDVFKHPMQHLSRTSNKVKEIRNSEVNAEHNLNHDSYRGMQREDESVPPTSNISSSVGAKANVTSTRRVSTAWITDEQPTTVVSVTPRPVWD